MAISRALRERGAAAVEMAIVLPLLLLLVGGIVDWGRFMYTQSIVTNAAREAARALSIGYPVGPAGTAGSAKARFNQSVFGLTTTSVPSYQKVSGVTVTVLSLDTDKACPAGAPIGSSAQVTITVSDFTYFLLDPAVKLFGSSGITARPNAKAVAGCAGT